MSLFSKLRTTSESLSAGNLSEKKNILMMVVLNKRSGKELLDELLTPDSLIERGKAIYNMVSLTFGHSAVTWREKSCVSYCISQ